MAKEAYIFENLVSEVRVVQAAWTAINWKEKLPASEEFPVEATLTLPPLSKNGESQGVSRVGSGRGGCLGMSSKVGMLMMVEMWKVSGRGKCNHHHHHLVTSLKVGERDGCPEKVC